MFGCRKVQIVRGPAGVARAEARDGRREPARARRRRGSTPGRWPREEGGKGGKKPAECPRAVVET